MQKEEILDHIQRIYLPYTVIDVGWWYQITLPLVPSGKFEGRVTFGNNNVIGGGNNPSALVNLDDIGRYVTVIINDERTINKKVFAYTESKTQNEIFELVEKVTGEKPERTEVAYSLTTLEKQTKANIILTDVQGTNRSSTGTV